ncbi:MAG: amidohydrolase family protein [Acidimicrobiales bacterium]|nr:amidohydrolase family protein [Acidimicrobiales bacterium]
MTSPAGGERGIDERAGKAATAGRVHTIVRGADVVTMNDAGTVLHDAAVAIAGERIAAVGAYADLRAEHPEAVVIGDGTGLVTPGYVNAHQHLTGDRLIASCIPDAIDSQDAIFGWAVPVHSAHTGDDDELSATLGAIAAVTNGITCTVEAGTVAHPDRVAAGIRAVGMRATLGQWGWDAEGVPFGGTADEVLGRQAAQLDAMPAGGLVEGWVTLVGHDLMSDDLAVRASELARSRGVGITFHISPHTGDPASYLQRTGRRPLVHLDELGVLGPHVLLAHAVHLDDTELDVALAADVAIASCPWAYLRLAQGFLRHQRHGEFLARGGRLALGCDAENAGDAVDVLRAGALLVGVIRDSASDPFVVNAHDALALATVGGARAIRKADVIGSLEVGKQADVVVHDTAGPQFTPRATDPVRQLVWASDGRSVRHVLVAGRHVVGDGRCLTVDLEALRDEITQRQRRLLDTHG